MILYSIIPREKIFEEPPVSLTTRRVPGGFVEGVSGEGGFTVSRLCSTDPRLYLDARYQPGSLLPAEGEPPAK